jgi:hypothetical protein
MAMNYLWIILAAFLGFSTAAIFSGWLKLKRNIYLLFYIPVVLAFVVLFVISNDINIKEQLLHNWYWGIAGALVAALFVIKNVYSQPSSARNKNAALLVDILWPGLMYGLADALLLSIVPILAIRSTFAGMDWPVDWQGRISLGVLAMLASLFVTTCYHLGYSEFRGKKVLWPNVGNGVLSLAFLITMNPLAAILPHIAMHIAAMLHGPGTTGQVPPHYNEK